MPNRVIKYYSTKDIMDMLSVSKSKAYEIMQMFRESGDCIKIDKNLRVRAGAFEAWMRELEVRGA